MISRFGNIGSGRSLQGSGRRIRRHMSALLRKLAFAMGSVYTLASTRSNVVYVEATHHSAI
jgi:hypothetical protein